MAGEIVQISLVATRRLETSGITRDEQLRQVQLSGKRYEADSITGLLIVNHPRLLYHLEGNREAVERHRARINSDHRLQGVVLLRERTRESRAFRRWDCAIDSLLRAEGRTLVATVTDLVADAPEDIRQTLIAFARLGPGQRAA